ncbi:B3 domain-containing transcription factor VRN1 isoform X2 [Ricinus communis]|uniref:B3 domain-containing transcription factor VRN1 isoform X2 n=1 Tax=Ricinus communis TaxID=3988 RepID=UPI00201A4B19|nr:B3 domain-containing transcription factor VRN1 isoform X2 [Ricinus communis]
MAISTQRDSDRLLFKATRPHFFKIVLNDVIRDKKLGFPRKFVRKYGDILPNTVVLKVPSGDIWRIELIKCNGEIWLQKGWQEFMEFYSLAFGFFLVFQYDQRNCHFNVIILDTSASEIDYPCRNNGENEVPIDLEEEFVEPRVEQVEKDAFVEILNAFSSSRKRKEKSPVSSGQPLKKKKLENPTRQYEANTGNGSMSVVVAKTQQLSSDQKAYLLKRARVAFNSKNPAFTVTLQSSYIHPGYQLGIPAGFVNQHVDKKYSDVILKAMDGRSWPVKCYKSKTNGRTTAKLYNGWKKFAQENRLEVGDVCAFELVSSKETTFRVVIFRNGKDASSSPSFGNSEELNHEKQNATCKKIIKGTYDEAANKLTENILQSGHQVRLAEAFPSACTTEFYGKM